MSSSDDVIQFVTSQVDYVNMPCLQDMFNKMEAMIKDGLKIHPTIDEVELRRRLAGNLCWNDLAQLEGCFQKPIRLVEKKPMTVWNEVVREVSGATQNFNFCKDMGAVKRRYDEIKNDPEIISGYEENLQRENLQRENTFAETLKAESFRVVAYKKAKMDLKKMVNGMLLNYNCHIIVHAVCEAERQFDYPPLSFCNSGQFFF